MGSMRAGATIAIVAGMAIIAVGCDSKNSSPGPWDVYDAGPPDAGPTAELTPWSPTGTFKVPAYGIGCRYGTDHVYRAVSNGATDDKLTLTPHGTGDQVSLDVEVNTEQGKVLAATVTLERGLVLKSYREAVGTASWGNPLADGEVVDGTLCFEQKLTAGTDTAMEFSLVIKAADGVHHSVSGGALLSGAGIAPDADPIVQSDTLDIDLR